jgi:hypothetical protein
MLLAKRLAFELGSKFPNSFEHVRSRRDWRHHLGGLITRNRDQTNRSPEVLAEALDEEEPITDKPYG